MSMAKDNKGKLIVLKDSDGTGTFKGDISDEMRGRLGDKASDALQKAIDSKQPLNIGAAKALLADADDKDLAKTLVNFIGKVKGSKGTSLHVDAKQEGTGVSLKDKDGKSRFDGTVEDLRKIGKTTNLVKNSKPGKISVQNPNAVGQASESDVKAAKQAEEEGRAGTATLGKENTGAVGKATADKLTNALNSETLDKSGSKMQAVSASKQELKSAKSTLHSALKKIGQDLAEWPTDTEEGNLSINDGMQSVSKLPNGKWEAMVVDPSRFNDSGQKGTFDTKEEAISALVEHLDLAIKAENDEATFEELQEKSKLTDKFGGRGSLSISRSSDGRVSGITGSLKSSDSVGKSGSKMTAAGQASESEVKAAKQAEEEGRAGTVTLGKENTGTVSETAAKGLESALKAGSAANANLKEAKPDAKKEETPEEKKARKAKEKADRIAKNMPRVNMKDIETQRAANLKEASDGSTPDLEEVSGKLNNETRTAIRQNIRAAIEPFTAYLNSDTMRLMGDFAEQMDSVMADISDEGDFDAKAMNELAQELVQNIMHQEVESNRKTFTDHGVRHVVNNIKNQQQIMKALKKSGVNISGRDRLIGLFAMANHDMGYTVAPVRENTPESIDASSDHKEFSEKLMGEMREKWSKVFTPEEYDRALDIIKEHDGKIDTPDNPVKLATQLADNLAVFQKEKLPSLFRYVDGGSKMLVSLGEAGKAYKAADKAGNAEAKEAAKQEYHRTMDTLVRMIKSEGNLTPQMKRDLTAAAMGARDNYRMPEFAMGTLSGELRGVSSGGSKSVVAVKVKHNEFNDTLGKVFDMKQAALKKMLTAYDINPPYTEKEYHIGKMPDGKPIVTIQIED